MVIVISVILILFLVLNGTIELQCSSQKVGFIFFMQYIVYIYIYIYTCPGHI